MDFLNFVSPSAVSGSAVSNSAVSGSAVIFDFDSVIVLNEILKYVKFTFVVLMLFITLKLVKTLFKF